ncbi:class I SAM-dependent methyltransferase [Streptomyces sp. NPDC001393]
MVDRSFADLSLARLYDALNPWDAGDDFYLDLAMSARSVLDVGCGTGRLLARAHENGHPGRLTGLEPAAAMLVQARRRAPAVEWALGDLRSHSWNGAYDLVLMTGHAFQTLVSDEDVRCALAAVRAALAPGGRFVFETRNPAGMPWTAWTPDRVRQVTDADGRLVRVWHQVEEPVTGDRVTFTETFEGEPWETPRVSRSTLRFLGPEALSAFLAQAGLRVTEQYGDFGRGRLTRQSPEILTTAERS